MEMLILELFYSGCKKMLQRIKCIVRRAGKQLLYSMALANKGLLERFFPPKYIEMEQLQFSCSVLFLHLAARFVVPIQRFVSALNHPGSKET